MQEATRKYLDNLPKIHCDTLERELKEGDIVYRYAGSFRDWGMDATTKYTHATKGGLYECVQRGLAVQRKWMDAGLCIRYHLVREDGTEYEIVV